MVLVRVASCYTPYDVPNDPWVRPQKLEYWTLDGEAVRCLTVKWFCFKYNGLFKNNFRPDPFDAGSYTMCLHGHVRAAARMDKTRTCKSESLLQGEQMKWRLE